MGHDDIDGRRNVDKGERLSNSGSSLDVVVNVLKWEDNSSIVVSVSITGFFSI